MWLHVAVHAILNPFLGNICESPCRQKYVSYGAAHRADESAKTKKVDTESRSATWGGVPF